MQWSHRQPFGRPAVLDRLVLRRAALRYAAHGWAVTPGACFTGHRFACHRPGCPITGCHPAIDSWADDAATDPARVAGWWRDRPYTVLLATGSAFDVLEVPAALGLRVLGATRLHAGLLGPDNVNSPASAPETMRLQVRTLSTGMPAASGAAGYSPTPRSHRPQGVR